MVLFGVNLRVEGDGVGSGGRESGSGEVDPRGCVFLGLMKGGSEGWGEFEFEFDVEMRFGWWGWRVGVLDFWNGWGWVGWIHGKRDRDGMVNGSS